MNKLILLLIFFFPLNGLCQDTTFFDFTGLKVADKTKSYYYQFLIFNPKDSNQAKVYEIFTSGSKKAKWFYSRASQKELHGSYLEWYENGQLKIDATYSRGDLHDTLYTYWINGQLKRKDVYSYGEFIEGEIFDDLGRKRLYYDFYIMPEFPGGEEALFRYLGTNLEYPPDARDRGEQGIIYVTFQISEDGKVKNLEVLKGVSEPLDNEALRVVREGPDWIPGMKDGEKVAVQYNLPIRFTLR